MQLTMLLQFFQPRGKPSQTFINHRKLHNSRRNTSRNHPSRVIDQFHPRIYVPGKQENPIRIIGGAGRPSKVAGVDRRSFKARPPIIRGPGNFMQLCVLTRPPPSLYVCTEGTEGSWRGWNSVEGRRVGFRVDPRALRDPVHPRHPGNAASPRFTVK